jgi:hypothetical protein
MTTTDIAGLCKKLREHQPAAKYRLLHEAADTIERQAAEIERLRGALAACVNAVAYTEGHDGRRSYSLRLTFGAAFQKARAALTGEDA